MDEAYEEMIQDDVDHQCSIAYQKGIEGGVSKNKKVLGEIADKVGQMLVEPKCTMYGWREIKELWDILEKLDEG